MVQAVKVGHPVRGAGGIHGGEKAMTAGFGQKQSAERQKLPHAVAKEQGPCTRKAPARQPLYGDHGDTRRFDQTAEPPERFAHDQTGLNPGQPGNVKSGRSDQSADRDQSAKPHGERQGMQDVQADRQIAFHL